MTFNVRIWFGFDGFNIWPLRRGLVAGVLRRYQPDVVGFQETMVPNLPFFSRHLDGHRHVRGAPSGARMVKVYNPIFWSDAGRGAPVESSGGFWLSQTPDRHSTAWGANFARTATWVRFPDLLLVNLHLDHISEQSRQRGSVAIIDRIRSLGFPDVPTIVTGDFNANPSTEVHRIWLDSGLRDAWLELGLDDDDRAFTFHGFRARRYPAETRIDWILHTRHFRPRSVEIVRDARPPRYPSDHYPVFAVLERDHHV